MDYFEKYLRVAPFSHALWRSKEANFVKKVKFKRPLLDIGCGFGEFAGVFFKSKVEMGIDISLRDLVEAAKKKKYQKLILADARSLPFKNESFNTCLSISTLEHIKGIEKVLSEVNRVLKKDGLFIFTVPTVKINDNLLMSYLLKKIKLEFLARWYCQLIHFSFSHQTLLTKNEWFKLLKKTGFIIKDCQSTITKKEIHLWELGLIFALPTQITRYLFRKRLVFSPTIRIKIIKKIMYFINQLKSDFSDANLFFLCQKK